MLSATSWQFARAGSRSAKVPPVTVLFWAIKLLTTAMGEAASDYLVNHVNPFLAVGLGAVGLAIALAIQLTAPSYVPWRYWLAVVMVAVFGTMAADAIHIELGVPYAVSTVCFGIALAVIFAAWLQSEHTLSFHSIRTVRRELFYWAAVMATFALGTAAGDMAAVTLGLGYLASAAFFGVLIALPAIGWWRFRRAPIAGFWTAYVLTRPLGASVADWIGKARSAGGLAFGSGTLALLLAVLIIALVAIASRRRPAADSA